MRRSAHLRNIWDANGKYFTGHAWVNHTPGFDVVGELQEGDVIEFTAQVDEYFQVSRVQRIFDLPVRTPTTGCQLGSPMNIRKLGHIPTSDHGVKHDAHLPLFFVGTGLNRYESFAPPHRT